MSLSVVLLVLGAAAIHAGWNLLLSRADLGSSGMGAALIVGTLGLLPFAAADLRIEPAAWPYLLASAGFELAYFALLATAYARAPAGVVFPLARGSAPVLVLLVSLVFFRAEFRPLTMIGIGLIAVGIVAVRGLDRSVRPKMILLALSVGACIAGYTLIDSVGLQHASPTAYLAVVMMLTTLGYLIGLRRKRAHVTFSRRAVVAGLGIVASYLVVLFALTRGPAAPVAALRETSVVLLMIMLALSGRERVTWTRAVGAVLVCLGVIAVVG